MGEKCLIGIAARLADTITVSIEVWKFHAARKPQKMIKQAHTMLLLYEGRFHFEIYFLLLFGFVNRR